jgi:hypothetical protein
MREARLFAWRSGGDLAGLSHAETVRGEEVIIMTYEIQTVDETEPDVKWVVF